MCKSLTADLPDQQKCKPNKGIGSYNNFMLNALPVSEHIRYYICIITSAEYLCC